MEMLLFTHMFQTYTPDFCGMQNNLFWKMSSFLVHKKSVIGVQCYLDPIDFNYMHKTVFQNIVFHRIKNIFWTGLEWYEGEEKN